jgi:hypothetical protein
MMPARLTSSLLVRRGRARPGGGRDAQSCGQGRPLAAGGALTRPAALRGKMVEILVPARAPMPRTAGSGRSGEDDPVSLTVRIDRTMHTRLRVLAAREQRTNRDIVRCALAAYLDAFAAGCACVGGAKPKA